MKVKELIKQLQQLDEEKEIANLRVKDNKVEYSKEFVIEKADQRVIKRFGIEEEIDYIMLLYKR